MVSANSSWLVLPSTVRQRMAWIASPIATCGRERCVCAVLAFGLLISGAVCHGQEEMSKVRTDETILFFPTAARQSDAGDHWLVPIHGWIFEREERDLLRRAAMRKLVSSLNLDPDDPTTPLLRDRLMCRH